MIWNFLNYSKYYFYEKFNKITKLKIITWSSYKNTLSYLLDPSSQRVFYSFLGPS